MRRVWSRILGESVFTDGFIFVSFVLQSETGRENQVQALEVRGLASSWYRRVRLCSTDGSVWSTTEGVSTIPCWSATLWNWVWENYVHDKKNLGKNRRHPQIVPASLGENDSGKEKILETGQRGLRLLSVQILPQMDSGVVDLGNFWNIFRSRGSPLMK